jgi:precorrin-2 dehydrogenase / sirohydrochlorin ferrochelatase
MRRVRSKRQGLYPLALDVAGQRCLVVGGGPVAERKVRGLLACGAAVTVVSPEITPQLQRWKKNRKYTHLARAFRATDAKDCRLVFAATNGVTVQQDIQRAARRYGTLVNRADNGARGDFHVAASIRRGAVTIGISTDGSNPSRTKRLRERMEQLIGSMDLT